MRHDRKAKIVATLGPASDDPGTIRALAEAGVSVFRLNFSHGTHADHRRRFTAIRKAEKAGFALQETDDLDLFRRQYELIYAKQDGGPPVDPTLAPRFAAPMGPPA